MLISPLHTIIFGPLIEIFDVKKMDDPELEAIRRARMAELQSRGGASSPSGGYGGPGMGGSGGAGSLGQSGRNGGSGKEQEDAEAQDEMKRQALSTILDPEARERCE